MHLRTAQSLPKLRYPTALEKFGGYVFSGCTSLKSVTFSKGITSIANGTFSDCESLKSFAIPDTVTEIGSGAFKKSGITDVKIPSSVTKIGERAFGDCPNLKTVSLPAAEIEMQGWEFCYCPSLTSITVDEKNPKFSSIDGNLYSKDKKTLYQYAIGKKDKTFTVPNTVTTIGIASFGDAKNLTGVILPDGLTTIERSAFWGADSLKSIDIPDTVIEMHSGAFMMCTSYNRF